MTRTHIAETIHASTVSVRGHGVLIMGASGSGKSGLALRMMALGADLVADDRVQLSGQAKELWAQAPAAIQGMIEARGIGVISVPFVSQTVLSLVVDLDRDPSARMPQRCVFTRLGANIPLILGRGVPNLASTLMFLARTGGVTLE